LANAHRSDFGVGGEKQRLAIARLILKDPPLLCFDEATAALDTHTEQALLQNINSILKEKRRTSIFVAHRLRTIYDSDLIIVLRDGQVAESGTHEQLVDRGGLYSELWSGESKYPSNTIIANTRCSSRDTIRRRRCRKRSFRRKFAITGRKPLASSTALRI
jgi:ABC-type glutathione transport system ATPase component